MQLNIFPNIQLWPITLPIKKNVCFLGGTVDYTSSPFHRQSILAPNFASCLSSPFFLSSSLQLITYSLVSVPVFVSEPTFMQQKFAYDVGLVSTYSANWYSKFSRFIKIKFKVSLLISLLYTPNKDMPSFCWNLHLILVHCHKLLTTLIASWGRLKN